MPIQHFVLINLTFKLFQLSLHDHVMPVLAIHPFIHARNQESACLTLIWTLERQEKSLGGL